MRIAMHFRHCRLLCVTYNQPQTKHIKYVCRIEYRFQLQMYVCVLMRIVDEANVSSEWDAVSHCPNAKLCLIHILQKRMFFVVVVCSCTVCYLWIAFCCTHTKANDRIQRWMKWTIYIVVVVAIALLWHSISSSWQISFFLFNGL